MATTNQLQTFDGMNVSLTFSFPAFIPIFLMSDFMSMLPGTLDAMQRFSCQFLMSRIRATEQLLLWFGCGCVWGDFGGLCRCCMWFGVVFG